MEKVVLYSNGCPKCRVLEAKLSAKNIEFEKSNNFEKLLEQGKQSLPFLEVGGELLDFVTANTWVNDYIEGEVSEDSSEIMDSMDVLPA